jgi:hypothetical protein
LHATGLAFDDEKQPDLQLFRAGQVDSVAFYRLLFRMIFTCADTVLDTNSTVVLSLVGGNNFAHLYPGGLREFWRMIWIPALEHHLLTNPGHRPRLRGMGFPAPFLALVTPDLRERLRAVGRFPALIDEYDRTKTLFINAWDPWSIVGNGNAQDQSLDGWVGRSSNAGILSSSLTNPFLTDSAMYRYVR